MNWYHRHFRNSELVVCKRCCSIFYEKDVNGRKECPKCKHNVENKDSEQNESMERIRAKIR